MKSFIDWIPVVEFIFVYMDLASAEKSNAFLGVHPLPRLSVNAAPEGNAPKEN